MRGFKSPWTLWFRMSRSTTVVPPAVNGKVGGSSPPGTALFSRDPKGSAAILTGSCSWESSRSPKPAQWVRILPSLLLRPRGPAWSGRHSVKVEIGSSNLLGDARTGPCPERSGTRLIRGSMLVRVQPVLLMVSWSSGMLATLTWWRSLVRIQPGLLICGMDWSGSSRVS